MAVRTQLGSAKALQSSRSRAQRIESHSVGEYRDMPIEQKLLGDQPELSERERRREMYKRWVLLEPRDNL